MTSESSAALDQCTVFGRVDDRGDMPLQQIDDRLRGAGAGTDAEPAETHEVDAMLGERRDLRQAAQPLGCGDRQDPELLRLVLRRDRQVGET